MFCSEVDFCRSENVPRGIKVYEPFGPELDTDRQNWHDRVWKILQEKTFLNFLLILFFFDKNAASK